MQHELITASTKGRFNEYLGEFLAKLKPEQLIDVKYSFQYVSFSYEVYTALIIYKAETKPHQVG